MRKILMLLGILTAGILLFYFLVWEKGRGSLWGDDTNFALEDTSSITRIVLTRNLKGQEAEKIELSRKVGEEWKLNGQYTALQSRVSKLMNTMSRLQVRQLLNDKGEKTGKKIIETAHTKVEAFEGGKEVKSYYLGTQTQDAKGSIMLMEGASTPYIVELPGLQGYVNTFYPTDFDAWRQNLLFKADFASIQDFQVVYKQNPENSFSIRHSDGKWISQESEGATLDAAQEEAFRNLFKGKIYAEEFVTTYYPGKIEELRKLQADVFISITYKDQSIRNIHMYERPENPNNFFAWIEGEPELITVQHFVIDKFLKKKEELEGAQVVS